MGKTLNDSFLTIIFFTLNLHETKTASKFSLFLLRSTNTTKSQIFGRNKAKRSELFTSPNNLWLTRIKLSERTTSIQHVWPQLLSAAAAAAAKLSRSDDPPDYLLSLAVHFAPL